MPAAPRATPDTRSQSRPAAVELADFHARRHQHSAVAAIDGALAARSTSQWPWRSSHGTIAPSPLPNDKAAQLLNGIDAIREMPSWDAILERRHTAESAHLQERCRRHSSTGPCGPGPMDNLIDVRTWSALAIAATARARAVFRWHPSGFHVSVDGIENPAFGRVSPYGNSGKSFLAILFESHTMIREFFRTNVIQD